MEFEINHIDSIIVLQKPKLSGFIQEMKYKIADALQIDESSVSVKATTTDHLGYLGKGEGIAAQAIATLKTRLKMGLDCPTFSKVNIGLKILSQRNDGYHNIYTVFQELDFGDSITIKKADSGCTISSNMDLVTNR